MTGHQVDVIRPASSAVPDFFFEPGPPITRAARLLILGTFHVPITETYVRTFADAKAVLDAGTQNGTYSKEYLPHGRILDRWKHPNDLAPWAFDPPTLGEVRKPLEDHYRPKTIRTLQQQVESTCEEAIDAMLSENPEIFDVLRYGYTVSFRTICAILGVDTALAPTFERWMRQTDTAKSVASLPWMGDMRRALKRLIRQRRAHPRHDERQRGVLDHLIDVQAGGYRINNRRLSDQQLRGYVWSQLAAGTETNASAIANTILFTAQCDLVGELADDRERARLAVKESLRLYPPYPEQLLLLKRDTTIAGLSVERGRRPHMVKVSLFAAHRDRHGNPDDDLDRFDIDRAQLRSLAFGFGPHYCIGRHLGEMVATTAVHSLAGRLPDLALGDLAAYQRVGGPVHHLASLKVATNL